MPNYTYRAAGADGRETRGTIQADTLELARSQIKASGLIPVTVASESALSKDINLKIFNKRPNSRDLSVFCRQFVSIINSGVPVVSAMAMLSEQTENAMLKSAISDVKTSIETGETLADAMRPFESFFTPMFITMVEAGEASGSIDKSFSRMADQFEKQTRLTALVRKASIYPSVLIIVTVAVVFLMLKFVIPTFEGMFDELNTELPAITVIVMGASRFVQDHWLLLFGIIAAAVLIIRIFLKTEQGQKLSGTIGIRLPILGNLTVKSAAARFARTLGTLIGAGLPMLEALTIVAQTMTNYYFRRTVLNARDEVMAGSSLSEPLERDGVFPPLVYHMLGIGEKTGDIDGMLDKIAEYYDEEVERATAAVTAAMEPAILIVLAAVVGAIIMAIMMPMAEMYTALDSI